jgi:hypothetical protein
MNGLDSYHDGLLAEHQRSIDEQAHKEEEMGKLKDRIIDLLEENHPNELARLTGEDEDTCLKIVHELLSKDPNDWEPERSGDIWAIYGKTFSAEWIDEHGDYLGFDTKREANDYIKENIK